MGGSISGTVKDETGAGIPAAQVLLKNLETGAERKLVSDESGRYSAPSVAVGRYEVTGSKENFQSQTKTGIELVVGQATSVDLSLALGDVKPREWVPRPSKATGNVQARNGSSVSCPPEPPLRYCRNRPRYCSAGGK